MADKVWLKPTTPRRAFHQSRRCASVGRPMHESITVSAALSSALILEAETVLREARGECGPDGMLTYVFDAKIQRRNERHRKNRPPGYCFRKAGWAPFLDPATGEERRSADGRKTLLTKPFELAGVAPAAAPRREGNE